MSFGTTMDGLYYERLIYEKVATPLVGLQVTPCVVPFIAYIRVNNRYDKCDKIKKKSKDTQEICSAIGRSNFHPKNLSHGHALVTEGSTGNTLYDWVKESSTSMHITDSDIEEVMFQLIYTLQCFSEIGLLHNDLHSGNVFVDINDSYKELTFVVSSKKIRTMTPRYLLKIYDFDRSTKFVSDYPHFRENIINSFMYTHMDYAYGAEPVWDPRIDIIRIMGSIHRKLNPKWQEFVEKIVDVSKINEMYIARKISYVDTMCYRNKGAKSNNACIVKPRTTARYAILPKEALNLFDESYTTSEKLGPRDPSTVFSLPSASAMHITLTKKPRIIPVQYSSQSRASIKK